MSQFPWFKMAFLGTGIMGVGYILMRTTSPTEEQLYARMAPDLRKKVDANRAARLARESAAQHQETAQLNDPDAQKPVWADPPKA